MASTSSSLVTKTCFHCTAETPHFRKGWQLRNGGFAELCDRCGSAYEEGSFCAKFHFDADGWRDCAFCGKRVHCGCIMSFHIFTELDFGGVSCVECFKDSFNVLQASQLDEPETRPQATEATPSTIPAFPLEIPLDKTHIQVFDSSSSSSDGGTDAIIQEALRFTVATSSCVDVASNICSITEVESNSLDLSVVHASPRSSGLGESSYSMPIATSPLVQASLVKISYTHGAFVPFKDDVYVLESMLPLLERACQRHPSLWASQVPHSSFWRSASFLNLGTVLEILHHTSLDQFAWADTSSFRASWFDLQLSGMDVAWLKPLVDQALDARTLISSWVDASETFSRRCLHVQQQVSMARASYENLCWKLAVAADHLKDALQALSQIDSETPVHPDFSSPLGCDL